MAEPLNPTFFAWCKREGGGALLGASLAYTIGLIVLVCAFAALVWQIMGGTAFYDAMRQSLEAAARGEDPTPYAPPNLLNVLWLFPLEIVFFVFYFILHASYESACVRWMVRGERSGVLGLCFGADMWRVYATYWCWLLYAILSWVGFVIFLMIAAAVAVNAGDAGPWVIFGLCLTFVLAWIHVTVRLSPAAATSVGVGEFAPLRAWSASRDRFWSLFGAYLLLWLLYVVAATVFSMLIFGATLTALFAAIDPNVIMTNPERFSEQYERAVMQAMFSVITDGPTLWIMIGGQILLWVIGLAFYVLLFGIGSRAVQAALEEGKIHRVSADSR